jgi:hypothetical protein
VPDLDDPRQRQAYMLEQYRNLAED